MPDDSGHDDSEIIRAAYGERAREAFIVFAENLSSGQGEKACTDRFLRALQLARKARDLALHAISAEFAAETQGSRQDSGAAGEELIEPLSPEDQAMVDQALAGTTGHAPVVQPRLRPR